MMKKMVKRMVSLGAAAALVLGLSAAVLAQSTESEAPPCPAHVEHNAECGYVAGEEATPCTHQHGECGFVEAVPGAECTFVLHEHVSEGENTCGFDGMDETTCTFVPDSHEHAVETCGYVQAVEGQLCTHNHDEACGYAEGVGAPCTHTCEMCAAPSESAPLAAQGYFAPKALPVSALGQPYDGIDFEALAGRGIYHGTYRHYNGTTYEANPTPILWRVMGEELTDNAGSGYLTAMSEYVLDSMAFSGNDNTYSGSTIQGFLAGTFMNGFSAAEKANTVMVPVDVTTTDYTWGVDNTISGPPPGTYGSIANGQQAYPLWGITENGGMQSVFWPANGVISTREAENANNALYRSVTGNPASGQATYKGGGPAKWWLRSPGSATNGALSVSELGAVTQDTVNSTLGVRPTFKLNPASVIFTTEIVPGSPIRGQMVADHSLGYAASEKTNYKLTVLNTALDANFSVAGQTMTGANENPTVAVKSAGNVTVALDGGSAPAGADSISYKIVDNSTRGIVGYGVTTSTSNIKVVAIKLRGAEHLSDSTLDNGIYTVYVWAQDINAQNSHEGGTPRYFTLRVNMDAPFVSGTFPNGQNVNFQVSTVSVTFNKEMSTEGNRHGHFSIQPSSNIKLTNPRWSNGNKTISYTISGLAPLTTYVYNIADFMDVSGAKMSPMTDMMTFTTKSAQRPGTFSAIAGATWSAGDFEIFSNGLFANFNSLDCDGEPLTVGTDYTAVSGSTIVTMKESFMQTLAAGQHTFTLRFSDGTATHTVTVEKATPGTPTPDTPTPAVGSPQTGDSSHMGLWAGLGVSALLVLGGAIRHLRKRRRTQ